MYQVLYVQKNEDIARHFMEEFLSSGYKLLVANTGEEALSIMEETDVLLLLVDINISDMRIRRLIKRAKSILPGIIVNVCIDVCDYKLITKLVNRYGVHKIYVAPWNVSEIIYEIGDSIEVALINEEVHVTESKLVHERTTLDETMVNLRSALTKQQNSYEKIKPLSDCLIEGIRELGGSSLSDKRHDFLKEIFDKYLRTMTTGSFSIDEFENDVKADLDELKARFQGFSYGNIISCFFGGVSRTDACNCRYGAWLIARLYNEFYENVTMNLKSHFVTTTEVKLSCTVDVASPYVLGEAKADEKMCTDFISRILDIIVIRPEITGSDSTKSFEYIVNISED